MIKTKRDLIQELVREWEHADHEVRLIILDFLRTLHSDAEGYIVTHTNDLLGVKDLALRVDGKDRLHFQGSTIRSGQVVWCAPSYDRPAQRADSKVIIDRLEKRPDDLPTEARKDAFNLDNDPDLDNPSDNIFPEVDPGSLAPWGEKE